MEQIVRTIATFFLPLAFLLVAYFLNRHQKSVPSKRVQQYRIQIEGVGYEIDPDNL